MSSSGKGKLRSLERARSAAPRSPRDLGGALSDVADDMRCELCGLDCADVPRLRSKRTGAVRHQECPPEEEIRAARQREALADFPALASEGRREWEPVHPSAVDPGLARS